ncbi:GHMP family kinase ATP-binding protein [Sulfuracidifex tepidarius]|uniref:Pantoate kinase n=1 Tax=Sulfuracidifex tepidarius TaxID=1294262 RepID=A0A510DYI0_9CREN|nr:hypothetical protein [Sulfuracidifex tepidarius]BBG25239.1 Pantoate kinase [Sulfuracidifex tepidarius]BBG28033.1 Pantoate kinase [Sulfuracidifex tepidarius]
MVLVRVPLSVSALWYPVIGNTTSESGSIGISITLEPALIAEVRKGEGVKLNGNEVHVPNLNFLERKLGKVRMEVFSRVPLGYGYGMSGAMSLAYALGISEISGIKTENAVEVAHESEVITGNGLGDVLSELHGGVVCRENAGSPSKATFHNFYPEDRIILTKTVEKLPTKSILSRVEWVPSSVKNLCNSLNIERIFNEARRFTEALGFVSPYADSYRKKGIIVKMGNFESGVWTVHTIARKGASVV